MAYNTLLTIGPVHTILRDVVYALPARTCRLQANGVIQISMDGTTFADLTGSNTLGAETNAPFARAHADDTLLIKVSGI